MHQIIIILNSFGRNLKIQYYNRVLKIVRGVILFRAVSAVVFAQIQTTLNKHPRYLQYTWIFIDINGIQIRVKGYSQTCVQ